MSILQLLLYRDLPNDFLCSYGCYIGWRKRLRNGWDAVFLRNKTLFLLHHHYTPVCIPACKKIIEAKDGKMMVSSKGKHVVYDSNGTQLTPFNKYSQLYPNGWYQQMEKGAISLYNNNHECVGFDLRYAKVYKNGMYLISVISPDNACFAGIFDANGKRLYCMNNKKAYVLPNGWFVTENKLFDNLGNLFIDSLPDRKIFNWLLCLTGYFMKSKKN